MNERHQNNNPWADKLSRVSIQDSGEAWDAMEVLLDKEMPVDGRGGWRRWVLLLLLLLLLVGVCNCPGREHLSGKRPSGDTATQVRLRQPDGQPSSGDSFRPGTHTMQAIPLSRGGTNSQQDSLFSASSRSLGDDRETGKDNKRATQADDDQRTGAGNNQGTRRKKTASIPAGTLSDVSGGRPPSAASPGRKKTRPAAKHHHGRQAGVSGSPENDTPPAAGDVHLSEAAGGNGDTTDTVKERAVPATHPAKDTAALQKPGGLSSHEPRHTPAKKDSAKTADRMKPTKVSEKKGKEHNRGWLAGIGLNQFFTVSGQQGGFNSDGLTGTLKDYLPVPMVRYYFNKHLYLQLEIQFNSPQYTRKNLVLDSARKDSLSPNHYLQSTATIKKLFYFNVPLSLHYSWGKHWNAGTGLQYSRLSNAVGVVDNSYQNQNGFQDSLRTITKSFKADTIYQRLKTSEFRFLLDASYTYDHWIFGARYNQSLSNFINYEVSGNHIIQARNSSLQLYVRYILWDGRKKKPDVSPSESQ